MVRLAAWGFLRVRGTDINVVGGPIKMKYSFSLTTNTRGLPGGCGKEDYGVIPGTLFLLTVTLHPSLR